MNNIFIAQAVYGVGSSPYGVAIADIDGDSKLDIVSSNSGSNTVSVLINRGTGTFAAAVWG